MLDSLRRRRRKAKAAKSQETEAVHIEGKPEIIGQLTESPFGTAQVTQGRFPVACADTGGDRVDVSPFGGNPSDSKEEHEELPRNELTPKVSPFGQGLPCQAGLPSVEARASGIFPVAPTPAAHNQEVSGETYMGLGIWDSPSFAL